MSFHFSYSQIHPVNWYVKIIYYNDIKNKKLQTTVNINEELSQCEFKNQAEPVLVTVYELLQYMWRAFCENRGNQTGSATRD